MDEGLKVFTNLEAFVKHTEILQEVRNELFNLDSKAFKRISDADREKAKKHLASEIDARKEAVKLSGKMKECKDPGMKKIFAIEIGQIVFEAAQRRVVLKELLNDLRILADDS